MTRVTRAGSLALALASLLLLAGCSGGGSDSSPAANGADGTGTGTGGSDSGATGSPGMDNGGTGSTGGVTPSGLPGPQLTIDTTSYQLVSSQRVDRTTFAYTYRVNVTNTGDPATNVRATVTSSAPATVITDADVAFGDVAGNGTVASSDTFTLKQDRTVPFDRARLSWIVTYDNPAGSVARSVVIDKPWIFLTGAGQSAPLTARILDEQGGPLSGAITWTSSAPDQVSVDATGRLVAQSIGSAQIFAEAEGIRSPPTLVVVAQPQPGALLVTDAQILSIGPPLGLDLGAVPGVGTQFEVVLQGVTAPEPGTVVLAAESAPLAGKVVTTRLDTNGVVATLAIAPLYELLADYNIKWAIDLSAFPLVPLEPAGTVSIQSITPGATGEGRARALGMVQRQSVGRFEAFKCDDELKKDLFKTQVNVLPTANLTLNAEDRPGYSRHTVEGTASLDGSASLILRVGFQAKGKCEALGEVQLPVFGWVSVIVMPGVRFGLGAELAGEVTLVQAEIGGTMKLGYEKIVTGWECGGPKGPGCVAVDEHKDLSEFTPKVVIPRGDQMQAKLSAQFYALLGLDAVIFKGFANGQILEAKAGPTQSFDLAFEHDQATRLDYASEFDLKLEAGIEPGDALKESIKKLINDDGFGVKFEAKTSLLVSESPKGSFQVSKTEAGLGGPPVDLTIRLDPKSLDYLGLGYNVNSIEIYRKKETDLYFTPWQSIPVTASNQSIFQYQWQPTTDDIGKNEFAAFVNAKLMLGLLFQEVAKDSRQTVDVQCFSSEALRAPGGPTAQAVTGRKTALGAGGRVSPADAATCADTWAGNSSRNSYRKIVEDQTYGPRTSETWETSSADVVWTYDPTQQDTGAGGEPLDPGEAAYIAEGTLRFTRETFDTHYELVFIPNPDGLGGTEKVELFTRRCTWAPNDFPIGPNDPEGSGEISQLLVRFDENPPEFSGQGVSNNLVGLAYTCVSTGPFGTSTSTFPTSWPVVWFSGGGTATENGTVLEGRTGGSDPDNVDESSFRFARP